MNIPESRRRRVSPLGSIDALEERVLLSARAASPTPQRSAVVQALSPHRNPSEIQARSPLTLDALRLQLQPAHAHSHAQRPPSPTAARWSWLADTYWYVPTNNLPSVLFNAPSQSLVALPDQTVFHITGYRDGYFWGVSVTQLGGSSPVCSSLIGSVTPQGRVLLNFTAMDDGSSPTITQGIGLMQRKFGQWTMENQMFTSPSENAQVGHWAYMVRTRPGLPSWQSLPSVGVSVEQFLSNCQSAGPRPIGL